MNHSFVAHKIRTGIGPHVFGMHIQRRHACIYMMSWWQKYIVVPRIFIICSISLRYVIYVPTNLARRKSFYATAPIHVSQPSTPFVLFGARHHRPPLSMIFSIIPLFISMSFHGSKQFRCGNRCVLDPGFDSRPLGADALPPHPTRREQRQGNKHSIFFLKNDRL